MYAYSQQLFLHILLLLTSNTLIPMRKAPSFHFKPRSPFLIHSGGRSSTSRLFRSAERSLCTHTESLNRCKKNIKKWKRIGKEAKDTSSTLSLVTLTITSMVGYLEESSPSKEGLLCVGASTLLTVTSLLYSKFAFYMVTTYIKQKEDFEKHKLPLREKK